MDRYGTIAANYFSHREAKAADGSGRTADRRSLGVLHRRHVRVENVTYIGKEANDIQERQAGFDDPDTSPPVYNPQRTTRLPPDAMEQLSQSSLKDLSQRTGLSTRRLSDILKGKANPRRTTIAKLLHAQQQSSTS